MIKPSGSQFGEQGQLFDDSEYKTPEKRPGQKGFDEWLATESPVFHGSARDDWERAPVNHYGTLGQATDRIKSLPLGQDTEHRAQYRNPGLTSEEYYDNIEFFDRGYENDSAGVFARRLTEKPMAGVLNDAQANAAEYGHRLNSGEDEYDIPNVIKQSALGLQPWDNGDENEWPYAKAGTPLSRGVNRARAGTRALDQGRPVKYNNFIEGSNLHDSKSDPMYRKSIIADSGSTSSWEKDVLGDPNQTSIAQDFAAKRLLSGQAGAVPVPSGYETTPLQLDLANHWSGQEGSASFSDDFPRDLAPPRRPSVREKAPSIRHYYETPLPPSPITANSPYWK